MGKSQGASSSQGSAGLGPTGAMSHAYIQYPPLRCDIPGAAGVMYDDGNKLLLVPAPSKVYSWPTNQQPPAESPSVTNIKDGPILAVRFSLDGKILAVQRTNREVEFTNSESCTGFKQLCRNGTERILGFFWTDCPACDLVFVTTSGLELYALYLGRNGLKLVEHRKANVSWYVYTHESRLVLLASGMQCKTLTGYQFAAGGIIRLPKYDVLMAKAESNRKPVLAPEDLRIATMYGRLYCVQVDRVALQLHMYRFYRDAVVPQGLMRIWPALLLLCCMPCSNVASYLENVNLHLEGSLPIYSPHVAISVVDNVLMVHQTDSQVVLLYDILTDPRGPISAPLPLLLRGAPSLSPSSRSAEKDKQRSLTNSEASIYGDGWVFVNPDLVLDHVHGLLWRVRLDLEAVAASSSNLPSLLAFLQRRRFEAVKAKDLSLVVMRSMIMERRPLPLIATAMDVFTSSYAQASRPPSGTGGPSYQPAQFSKLPSPVVAGGITLSAGPRGVVPASLIATPGVQSAGPVSSPVSSAISARNQRADDSDEEAVKGVFGGISDQEIGGTSEIEESPFVLPQEHLAAESSVSANDYRILNGEGSGSCAMEASTSSPTLSGLQGLRMGLSPPLVSPEDVQLNVFTNIEEEMAVDSTFLVSAIVEYMRSASKEHLRTPPGIQVLVVQLLARDERFHELRQLVIGKLVEPSRAVALKLLEVGAHHPPTHNLGMEMLRLLHAHSDYVKLLLQDGRLLEGLRYIRQNKVEAIPPAMFLEAAVTVNDPQKLAAVFRFCLDFVPGFQQSPDFTTYSSFLNQQCTVGGGDSW